MTAIWSILAFLVLVAGFRYRQRIRATRTDATPVVDDDAIDRIIHHGKLPLKEDDRLDLDEAAEAEEEFWDEYWDEPDEYRP